jgi:predicted nuclease of predicted toxin-antitoxin system
VIWLRVGNCTTAQIESLLRMHCEDVRKMQEDDSVCVLSLV